ncbi:MAG TPA: WXG100 family type VII secretion target [Pseudonocardia sp.]|nr:WXG100 family type VII secretion target [Pseudonocardia sp.]
MPGYEVNFGALQECANQIGAINAEVMAELEALRQQVNAVLPTWDGAARAAWVEVDRTWQQACAQMSEKLRVMQNFVNQANAQMQATEARNAALVGGR